MVSNKTGSWLWHMQHGLAVLLLLVGMVVVSSGGAWAAHVAAAPPYTLEGSVLIEGVEPAPNAIVLAIHEDQHPTAPVNASGAYSMTLGIGNWVSSVVPPAPIFPQPSPTWVYTAGFQLVDFNSSSDPQTLNFSVARASAIVSGTLLVPVGTPFSPAPFGNGNRAWVRAANQEGQGNTVQVNPLNGRFSVNVLPGNVKLHLVLENQDWAPPPELAGSVYPVVEGQNPVGALQLVEQQATIQGTVVDEHGAGVPNIPVRAWRRDGAEFEETTSIAGGAYAMHVISGTWELRAVPPNDSGYVTAEPPQRVVLPTDTASVTRTLHVVTADVTINGKVVDTNNSSMVLPVRGRAFALYRNGDHDVQLGPGVPITNGLFTLRLSTHVASDYRIGAFISPDSGYTIVAAPLVHVSPNQTIDNFTLPAVQNNSTISGHFKKADGSSFTGVPGIVDAVSNRLAAAHTRLNPLDGSYELHVATTNTSGAGGAFWWVHGFVDPTTGYVVQRPRFQKVFIPYNNGSGGTATVDFTVARIDAAIAGRVTRLDLQGNPVPVPGARVSVHERNTNGAAGFDRWVLTGPDGRYQVRVPAGTYTVRAAFFDLIAPVPAIVTVASNTTATANLQFRRADALISGRVTYNNAGHSAFIRAYSNTGARAFTLAGPQGFYHLRVNSGDIWHVQAVSEISTTIALTPTIFLKSDRMAITPQPSPPPNQLDLVLHESGRLPDALAFTFDAAEDQTLTLSDRSQVIIPSGALATSGQVVVVVRPLVELADDGGAQPVSFGYRLHAFDANHVPITHFNAPVTIVLPFTAAQLADLGVTAEDLVPSYWDEATASWKPVPNVTVEVDATTGDGAVHIQVDHFTDFALLAATDHALFLPLIAR